MKKVLIVILVLVVLLGGGTVQTYNRMVTARESVDNGFANIQTQLQRRADLIPNLVNTVKGYMEHEKEIIDSITEARAKLVNANGIQELADADEELTNTLKSLNVVVENYPDLKASANFTQLQDELAGTENRIAVARRDYNDAVRKYNTTIKRFPGVFIAGLFGFEKAEYFEASVGSTEVPSVSF